MPAKHAAVTPKAVKHLMAFSLLVSAFAHAQQLTSAPTPTRDPADPVGYPFKGPQTRFYGPRQAIQVDIDAMLAARFYTITIAGKTYQFAGSLKPVPDGRLLWMGEGVENKNNTMYLVRNPSTGGFAGGIAVDGHSYLLSGENKDALLVESFLRLLPDHPPRGPASSEPGGEPTRKAKLTAKGIAAERGNEISREEQRLAALREEKEELDGGAVEARIWAHRVPIKLQQAIDANAVAIAETEALLFKLRGRRQVGD